MTTTATTPFFLSHATVLPCVLSHKTSSRRLLLPSSCRRVGRGAKARDHVQWPRQKRWVTFSFLFLWQANNSWVATMPAAPGEQRAFLPMRAKGLLKGFSGQLSCCCCCNATTTQPHCGLASLLLALSFGFWPCR